MAEAIGILGGTFDPIHHGHLRAAIELRELLKLVEVRLLPSGHPPHRKRPVATPQQRCEMVRRALAGRALHDRLVADWREIDRPGPSYMVDTLASLRAEVGDRTPLLLLIGSDAFLSLHQWQRWQQLLTFAHIVVAHRPGWQLDTTTLATPLQPLIDHRCHHSTELQQTPAGRLMIQPLPPLAISATAIRQRVAAGRSIHSLLPDAVADYIVEQQLYLLQPTLKES